MARPVDITIASELSKVSLDSNFPATDLIAVLLQHIGASTKTFAGDVHTSGQVFHRSLAVYGGIRQLMFKVDQSTEAAPDWLSFDAYTSAIPPLEKLLLEFYLDNPDDIPRGLLPPSDDVSKAISFVTRWKKDRSMLKKALEDLADNTFQSLTAEVKAKVQESRQDSRLKDDQTILNAFVDFLQMNRLEDRHIIQGRGGTLLKDVKTSVSALATAVFNLPANDAAEDSRGVSIRAMLLVYIPFAFITSKEPSRAVKDHLRKTEIWEEMKSLLKHVSTHVKQERGAKTIAELEILLGNLARLLIGSGGIIPLADEILQLIKLAAVIRRPFHGQSVALISVLRHLDEYSKTDDNQELSPLRSELKQVMSEAITALEAARDAVTNVKAFTLESSTYKTEKDKLAKLYSDKIKKCFEDFQIADEYDEWQDKFASGVQIDEEHLREMRKRLSL